MSSFFVGFKAYLIWFLLSVKPNAFLSCSFTGKNSFDRCVEGFLPSKPILRLIADNKKNDISASDVCWGNSKKTFLWWISSWLSLARNLCWYWFVVQSYQLCYRTAISKPVYQRRHATLPDVVIENLIGELDNSVQARNECQGVDFSSAGMLPRKVAIL